MAKRIREPNPEKLPYAPRGGGGDGDNTRVLLLAGLALLLVLSGWSLAEVRGVRKELSDRVGQLDAKIAQLGTKVDSVAKGAAQPPQRGPDPNKVYSIKTEGAPYTGSPSAPVTIAEFSDFQ